MYLSQMKYHSIYDPLVKIDGLQQVILIKEQRQSIQIKFMHGEHLVRKELLNFNFFTGNMDSKQYIKMLSIANSEIWKLHPNGFILLRYNDSKHRSDISLNYYIENNIQLLEWPAYSPDLNPIENIWGNIKNNLRSKVYNKNESIKPDIEDYWGIWESNYSTKAIETMRKRIDACILLKEKRTVYKKQYKESFTINTDLFLFWVKIAI